MGKPSSIDKLAPEIRDWIGRLREQGATIDEIVAKLRELDKDKLPVAPSRSALHRHLQKAEAIAERMKRSRVVADTLVRRLGEAEPDKATRLNIELMHSVVFDLVTAAQEAGEDGEGGGMALDPMQVMLLAKSLDHLGKAAKDDVARTLAVEKRAAEKAREEALKATAKVLDEAAAGQPIDGKAVLRRIRAEIYGIHDD